MDELNHDLPTALAALLKWYNHRISCAVDAHDFSAALVALKFNHRVSRAAWNGMWLELQVPDEHSKMSRPYIFIRTTYDELVPWVASQSDLLADDWTINL